MNRLTSVDYGDGQTQSYAFDSMGNRASKTDAGGGMGGSEAYSYNAANMLLSRAGNPYINDANGNTLSGGGRTNTWDSQNRMVGCAYTNAAGVTSTSQFTYACDGLRHRSVTNGVATDFVLDASMFIREMSGGSVKATYFMGASGPAYRRDDVTGQVRWYLYDGLGSVLGEVDPQGNITAKRKYDVYGLSRSVTGTPTSKHAFVGSLGHPSEDETGLIYMQARYMDPTTGRFISQDPSKNGINWYLYASNNPVNTFDPDGKSDLSESMLCMGIVNGLIAGMINSAESHSFLWGFLGGFISGCLSMTGPVGSVVGPGLGTFITQMANGAGPWKSFLRAAVSSGLAGAGTWMVLQDAGKAEADLINYWVAGVASECSADATGSATGWF